jgi:signal transduction histidine kinase
MLDAAQLDKKPPETDIVNVELSAVLRSCAEIVCLRYHLPTETIRLQTSPSIVQARPIDLEIIFRNLMDNAIKYGGATPQVQVDSHFAGEERLVIRIVDNGRGIPAKLRRKIFGRFVRLGRELEREQAGTGLGLFIVRTLVKRLHGDVTVRDRPDGPGTIFEVQLPARMSESSSASAAAPRDDASLQSALDRIDSGA